MQLLRNLKNNLLRIFASIFFICLALIIIMGLQNKLRTTYYSLNDKTLPAVFNGYRIVVVSDFHCKEEGYGESRLIKQIEDCKPDLVVFIGDMIDGSHQDITPARELLSGLAGKYPMYAIDGNHERDILSNFNLLLEYYREYGVRYLSDQGSVITKGNSTIGIYGKSFRDGYYSDEFKQGPDTSKAAFNILLYHDALVYELTSTMGYDLVLSGHVHGGIIRLPFVGGLLSNTGGLFPKYDKGIYRLDGSEMIVSAGIGDSVVPRFNNPQEILCITLNRKE